MILHVDHLQPGLAARASEAVGTLLALVEEEQVDPRLLATLRLHLDRMRHRADFREPVAVRRATGGAEQPVTLLGNVYVLGPRAAGRMAGGQPPGCGLGHAGAYIGGTHDAEHVQWIVRRAEALAPQWEALAAAVERVEPAIKGPLFGCRACGNCVLGDLEYVCPQTCPKQMRNGPCGGTDMGRCEVVDQPCIRVDFFLERDRRP